jgi:hypothetical protein
VSEVMFVHVLNAFGKTLDNLISLIIILYFLFVFQEITVGAELHQQIDVLLIVKTGI